MMKKYQFIQEMRRLGFTDLYINKVLEMRERERAEGIRRRWEDYMPGWDKTK